MPKHKSKKVSFYMEKELQRYMTPEAKNFFLCTWYRYMFPYIPYKTGLLASLMAASEDAEQNITISPEQSMIMGLEAIKSNPNNVMHFKAPYANRQYEGTDFNFTRDLHPLAQAHWAQVAADLHGEQIINELKQYIAKEKKQK
jgi:hypothetical protein